MCHYPCILLWYGKFSNLAICAEFAPSSISMWVEIPEKNYFYYLLSHFPRMIVFTSIWSHWTGICYREIAKEISSFYWTVPKKPTISKWLTCCHWIWIPILWLVQIVFQLAIAFFTHDISPSSWTIAFIHSLWWCGIYSAIDVSSRCGILFGAHSAAIPRYSQCVPK